MLRASSDNSFQKQRQSQTSEPAGLYLGQFRVSEPSCSFSQWQICNPGTEKARCLVHINVHTHTHTHDIFSLGQCTHLTLLISEFLFQSQCLLIPLFISFTTNYCLTCSQEHYPMTVTASALGRTHSQLVALCHNTDCSTRIVVFIHSRYTNRPG